ncbi:MAG: hypothetical protein GF421_01515 [Candidatus Aminicenantes bacterium]|nr:hypothetical protein [Candidatus Aminicenantes bacterium]
MTNSNIKRPLATSGGIVLLTLGIALFGGSFVLTIDGLRAAGIALSALGIVLLLVASLLKGKTK